jgi:TPR repeat protein
MKNYIKVSVFCLLNIYAVMSSAYAERYWMEQLKDIRQSTPDSVQKTESLDYVIGAFEKIPGTISDEERLVLEKAVYERLVYEAEVDGNSWALFLLGYFYEHGIYVSKNLGQAYEKMREAAQMKNPEAEFRLGGYLSDEHSGAPYVNMAEAAYYMKDASEQGVSSATQVLKLWFIKGILPKSYLCQTKEMSQKQVHKQLQLAQKYYRGYETKQGEHVSGDLMQAYILLNDVIPNAIRIPESDFQSSEGGKKKRLPIFGWLQ